MMNWTPELRDFIQAHINDDTAELLLAARRYATVDVPFAVEQIEARRRLKGKLPEWYTNPELIMGGRVPAEQCSSELTARYKQGIVEGLRSLCDMTGGMGVDFWYMSEGMERAIYTERNEELCEVARHNFQALKGRNSSGEPTGTNLDEGGLADTSIEIRCGDGRKMPIPSVDVIYLDPARRAGDGSRVYAMENCEPNIVEWQDELLKHAKMVLVKLSPMVDLTDVLRKLKGVTDVHVVGVKNECKEVLVRQAPQPPKGEGIRSGNENVQIHCVDFLTDRTIEYIFSETESMHRVSFPSSARALASVVRGKATFSSFANRSLPPFGVGGLLYEPDVTLMKAGAFGSLCERYPVWQLDYDTHLMTSDEWIPDFPGRVFEVEERIPFSSKVLKRLKKEMPQANIATRNFVMTADELRRRTGIKDGGEVYLFGVKVKDEGQMLLKCRKKVVPSHP